jgi:hypothetical protein
MRDYGVVRTRFWEWAKRNDLTPSAVTMALYLLTCPHGNSLGCYRLPLAYVCDDVGLSAQAASDALAALDVVGFIERDADTGWTWIVGYLEHNPVPNGNVGKAVAKMLEAVPLSVSFYEGLIEGLEEVEHFPQNLLSTLMERYRNRSNTVARRSETHTQTPTHDHDHDQEHNHEHEQGKSVAIAPTMPLASAVDAYNEAAEQAGWAKVQRLSQTRIRALTLRMEEAGGLEGWQHAMAKAAASKFLTGKTPRSNGHANWRPDFDWFTTASNFTKLMEGSYDNSNSSPAPQSGFGAALAGLAD